MLFVIQICIFRDHIPLTPCDARPSKRRKHEFRSQINFLLSHDLGAVVEGDDHRLVGGVLQ